MINEEDYNISRPSERADQYNIGGYLAVHIDDLFKDGRYQILNKLGVGSFSTVWAARDSHDGKVVSLKIHKADHSQDRKFKVLEHIQKCDIEQLRQKYIAQILDLFYQQGPSGRHLIVATEVLGPTLSDFMQSLEPNLRLNNDQSRRISRQLLIAIEFLHSIGIIHGDVKPDNILLCLPEGRSQEVLKHVLKGTIVRKDGGPLAESLPRYVVESVNFGYLLDENSTELSDIDIRLVDFSESFFSSDAPTHVVTPDDFSPPELVFGKTLTKAIDIWNLACTTYWFSIGETLFFPSPGEDRRGIIPQIYKTIGNSTSQWLLEALFDAFTNNTWDNLPALKFSACEDWYNLENMVSKEYAYHNVSNEGGSDHEHVEKLTRHLRKMFVVDPGKRATAQELLNDEFVSGVHFQ